MSKLARVNWTYVAAVLIVYGFMAGAARFSYHHIVELFLQLGCSPEEARWAPVFIDGFAFLGWLGRRRQFADSTRRVGLRLMYGASVVSFLCNVFAGHTLGSRAFGALVVIGFMVAEWYADQLVGKPAKATRKLEPAVAAERAAKRAATIAAKFAAAAATELPVAASVAVAPQPVHVVSPTRPRTGAFGLPRQPLGERVSVLGKPAA